MAISVVSPIPGQKVGDRYGARPSFPLPGGGRTIPFHYGQDYPAPRGTKILAAHPGRVIRAGWDDGKVNVWPLLPKGIPYGGGWWVWIENEGLVTIYMHMKTEPDVNKGDWVGQGTVLGEVGTTGASTGDHLHFETLLGGTHVDPATVIGGQVSAGKISQEDDLTPEQSHQLKQVYNAIFVGGKSMLDGGKSISKSLQELNGPVARASSAKATVVTGKAQNIPVRQDNADTNTMMREVLALVKGFDQRLAVLEKK